ncbi:hypothetical protein D3C87_1660460 [compost metagenome]
MDRGGPHADLGAREGDHPAQLGDDPREVLHVAHLGAGDVDDLGADPDVADGVGMLEVLVDRAVLEGHVVVEQGDDLLGIADLAVHGAGSLAHRG